MIKCGLWKLAIVCLLVNTFAAGNIFHRLFGNDGCFNFKIFNFAKRNQANYSSVTTSNAIPEGNRGNSIVSTDEVTTTSTSATTNAIEEDARNNNNNNVAANQETSTNSEPTIRLLENNARQITPGVDRSSSNVETTGNVPSSSHLDSTHTTNPSSPNSQQRTSPDVTSNHPDAQGSRTTSSPADLRKSRFKAKNWFRRSFTRSNLLRLLRNITCRVENKNTNESNNKPATGQNVEPYEGPKYELECPVCVENLFSTETIVLLKCGHLLCKTCTEQIFQSDFRCDPCPICREKATRTDLRVFRFPTCQDHGKTIGFIGKMFLKNSVRKLEKVDFIEKSTSKKEKICYKPKCEKCLNDFSVTPNEPITMLSCGHIFCISCSKALEDPIICPLCKKIQMKSRQIFLPGISYPDT